LREFIDEGEKTGNHYLLNRFGGKGIGDDLVSDVQRKLIIKDKRTVVRRSNKKGHPIIRWPLSII
jgi:hypothetical protein